MSDFDLHSIVVGREAMACRFEFVFNAGEVPGDTELAIEALDIVDEIENTISIYRDTSELSRINATAACDWQSLSHDLFALLETAVELHARTDGAFDIAAGPLVRCWGFLQRQGRTPADDDLAAALAVSGTCRIELDRDGRRVRFLKPGAAINPGAIGKGWALDRALERLAGRGVRSVLAHGGQSSVRALGTQGPSGPGRRGWPVGMRHPLRPERRIATVQLVDRALGTSGSGTQFFIERGRKLGHILDPRTGLPAEGVLSATVLAPTAAAADALATAAYVLGPEGLPRIAPSGGDVAAILVVPGGSATAVHLFGANLSPDVLVVEPGAGVTVEMRS